MSDRYQIPAVDESPPEGMIDFLHENKEQWDGDESGITLTRLDGSEEHGAPGDWIVRDADGRYSVEKSDET